MGLRDSALTSRKPRTREISNSNGVVVRGDLNRTTRRALLGCRSTKAVILQNRPRHCDRKTNTERVAVAR